MNLRKLMSLSLLTVVSLCAFAQSDPVYREWNQPVEPFRVIGNVFYVGTAEISSFLIKTSGGLILIDGGFVETAPIIEQNLKKLGFKATDIRILLNSQAHLDHAGGLASLKLLSGATMLASAGDKPLLESGGHNDPQFGDSLSFPPIHVDREVHDGEVVALGGVTLRAVLTPGHTPGCTTWTLQVEDAGKDYNVVFLCGITAPGQYQLVNNQRYPKIVEDYERSFARLKGLPCDVFLGAHGSYFGLTEKIKLLRKGSSINPFIDPEGFRTYLALSEKAFHQKLEAQERAAKALK